MPYKFAIQNEDYADLASGRVISSAPGMPAFPVRLASEIFQRARAVLGGDARLRLYDPTCGAAYHLTALGVLHGAEIGSIIASDVDAEAVSLARRNLTLLTDAGLDRRESELRVLLGQFGKSSHEDALRSLAALRARLSHVPPVDTQVFQANVFNRSVLRQGLDGQPVDLVIADVPYGQHSAWRLDEAAASNRPALWMLLDALLQVIPNKAVVAIAADKAQKIAHEGYRRVDRFQVGKRQVALLTPNP